MTAFPKIMLLVVTLCRSFITHHSHYLFLLLSIHQSLPIIHLLVPHRALKFLKREPTKEEKEKKKQRDEERLKRREERKKKEETAEGDWTVVPGGNVVVSRLGARW